MGSWIWQKIAKCEQTFFRTDSLKVRERELITTQTVEEPSQNEPISKSSFASYKFTMRESHQIWVSWRTTDSDFGRDVKQEDIVLFHVRMKFVSLSSIDRWRNLHSHDEMNFRRRTTLSRNRERARMRLRDHIGEREVFWWKLLVKKLHLIRMSRPRVSEKNKSEVPENLSRNA